MKLFSISSPLIFYFAQNIALDLKSQDNLSLLWYSGGHENHLNTYHLLKNTEIWSKEIVFDDAVSYNGLSVTNIIKPQKMIRDKKQIEKKLFRIIEDNEISEIFIANRYMPFDRLLYSVAREKNIKINLLEDGLTSYLDFNYSQQTGMKSVFSKDGFKKNIKKTLFKNENLKFVFASEEDPVFENVYAAFPEKYYIKNFSNEVKALNLSSYNKEYYEMVRPILLKDPVFKMLMENKKKNILYLSQAISEDGLIAMDNEVKAIMRSLHEYNGLDYRIIIKPHPRDSPEKISRLQENMRKSNIDVHVLENNIPIPVEVLISHMELTEIIGIWTAALFYVNVIDQRIRSISILPSFIKESKNSDKLVKVYKKLHSVFANEVVWK